MTKQEAEKIAIRMGCCTWDQGNDGFGGEWEPHEKAVKVLMELTAPSELQRIKDEATKPLDVKIEALEKRLAASQPGEPGKARCPTDEEYLKLARGLTNLYLVNKPLTPALQDKRTADFLKRELSQFFRPSAPSPQPPRTPDGYAYRYNYFGNDTIIRFNGGEKVNGGEPIEAIPYYFGVAPSGSAGAEPGLSHEDICRLGRVFIEHSHWGRDSQDSRIHEWLKIETARKAIAPDLPTEPSAEAKGPELNEWDFDRPKNNKFEEWPLGKMRPAAPAVVSASPERQYACAFCCDAKEIGISSESVMACPKCQPCIYGCTHQTVCVSCKIHRPRRLAAAQPVAADSVNVHELKCWPEAFQAVLDDVKVHEWRKYDRPFCTGDILFLREWKPDTKEYTGRAVHKKIGYISAEALGIPSGWCVLSLLSSRVDSGLADPPKVEEVTREICEALAKTKSNTHWMEIARNILRPYFQGSQTPAPRFKIGDRVTWQGQEGACFGVIKRQYIPENCDHYVLILDIGDDIEFPHGEMDVELAVAPVSGNGTEPPK